MLQNELPDGQYFRIEQLAIRGYRQLHFHSIGLPKQVELEIMANGQACLPCDFLSKLRIGPVNEKGEIQALLENDLLSLGDNKPNAALGGDLSGDDNYYLDRNGYYPILGGQYGSGSLQVAGSYKLDLENQLVIFNPNCSLSDIHISYLPMVSEADDYCVHPFFQEALVEWLNWQNSKNNPKFASMRLKNEDDYNKALWKARRAMKPFNVGDMYNQYRLSIRLAIKS